MGVWVALAIAAVTGRAQAQNASDSARDIPPAGYGTLRQDDIAVLLSTPLLQIRVLPLDERVIRLLTNDTYTALHGLKEMERTPIASAAAQYGITDPSLFVVTFFGLQPRAEFVPEDVTITSRNRFFRPIGIIPLSPRWGDRQLNQRETATAVYVFENGISVLESFTVTYEGASSRSWDSVLRKLDSERAAVLARASADSTHR